MRWSNLCCMIDLSDIQVFDNNWHKLHFGVFRDKVVLYVNCQPVGEEPLQVTMMMMMMMTMIMTMQVVDSRIDLNGDIMIAKEADSQRTQAIDLQWMVMACDPDSVSRETCDELPVIVTIDKHLLNNSDPTCSACAPPEDVCQ